VPDLEKNKFNFLKATGEEVLKGEALAGLDDKVLDKFIVQDKLKAEKIKDALEKSRLKEVEKKKKLDEKAKEKTKKGKDKKTNVQDEVNSTVLDEVS
jgi:UTP:GlnB (protein PII) uridylyltransferase